MLGLKTFVRALVLAASAYACALALSDSPSAVVADTGMFAGQTLHCGDTLYASPGSSHRLECIQLEPPYGWGFKWFGGRCAGNVWTTFFDGMCPGIPPHMYQFSSAGSTGRLVMQFDGNLVLLNASFSPVWASNTAGNPGAYLAAQDDGNLVIYNASGVPIWSIW